MTHADLIGQFLTIKTEIYNLEVMADHISGATLIGDGLFSLQKKIAGFVEKLQQDARAHKQDTGD